MRKKIVFFIFSILALLSMDGFTIIGMVIAGLGFKYRWARVAVIPYGLLFLVLNLNPADIIMWLIYILVFSR